MNNQTAAIQADVNAISAIPAVESILEVICRTTGMGFAAVARVTREKWVACAVRDEIQFGLLPGGELVIESTICHEIEQSGKGVVIDHVERDPLFANHPTPATYGFQSYISVPITLKNGNFFGTLCAIDPRPNELNNPKIRGMFELFADLIAFHLNAVEQLIVSEDNLLQEKRTAEFREQFIAILGHDLRNPLTAALNSAQLLLQVAADDRSRKLAGIIQNSSYRMKGLIDNMLDFASGRLGGGIVLNTNRKEELEQSLLHVITELQSNWPERTIESKFELPVAVTVDNQRIAQLLSNLLSNALTYGDPGSPVLVNAESDEEIFTLSVANAGKRIPDATMRKLFQPFFRGANESRPTEGLGLGLYISIEIAKAHGGTLEVESNDRQTKFTLRLPVSAS